MCFNIRSLTRSYGSLPKVLETLEFSGKMCTPSINVDGSISAGEGNECCRIGFVNDDISVIENNIVNMKCNFCGLENNITDKRFRNAIGI